MPRVTKSVSAHAKHKKVITVQEVDYIKLQSSQTLNQCSMLFVIEKTKKELLGLYGLQGLTLQLENLICHIQN